MVSIELLDSRCTDDLVEWGKVWAATGQTPYAHPAFTDAINFGFGNAVALVAKTDSATYLMPLVLRPLPEALEVSGTDLVSPYGYGGPESSAGSPTPPAVFDAIRSYIRATSHLSVFVRLSLDAVDIDSLPADMEVVAANVAVNLSRTSDERWNTYDSKVRKNVRRARREGCTFSITMCPSRSEIERFSDLYIETMMRREAEAKYKFDLAAFIRLFDRMPGGSVWLASVSATDGSLAAAEVILVSARECFSFLGGTYQEFFPLRPNDLLKHSVCEWAMERGLERFILGGGYSQNDGIYRYKKSFAPESQLPFVVWRLVGDEARYFTAVSRTCGDGDFFPGYRAPR